MSEKVSDGRMRSEFAQQRVGAASPGRNWAELAISVAEVVHVHDPERKVTIRILTGEDQISRHIVDLVLPGAGRRHFLGAVPEEGDFCVVGWSARESGGIASHKTPVILGWIPGAHWMGYDWLPYQPMEEGEGMDTPRERAVLSGVAQRTRFKARPVPPGGILASSSQGSDLVLEEGVTLSNRRGNELCLRDADQAFVVRALQGFQVFAGVRTYSGAVRRDARLLQTSLFSDPEGRDWSQAGQMGEGNVPVQSFGDSPWGAAFLTPGAIFRRRDATQDSDFEVATGSFLQSSVDPFDFLRRGSFITPTGHKAEQTGVGGFPTAVYAGKTMFRVGLDPPAGVPRRVVNTASTGSSTPPPSLTEFRVEVAHTHDGTLPVSEQTDGFDSDRLPGESGRSPNTPFVEFVLGSVVGNDPFSATGMRLYAQPLVPTVFNDSGRLSPSIGSGIGVNIGEHAATLLRVSSPVSPELPASFSSFTKKGDFKAFVAGSAEVRADGHIRVSSGGPLGLSAEGGLFLDTSPGQGNMALSLGSRQGAVRIYGGGRAGQGRAAGGPGPSLDLEGSQAVRVVAGETLVMQAREVEVSNASIVRVHSLGGVEIQASESISQTTNTRTSAVSGQEIVTIGGPAGASPISGPPRITKFTSTAATGGDGGVVDDYEVVFGGREERFRLGSHRTSVTVGNLTYETSTGKVVNRAGGNSVDLDSVGGQTVSIAAGNSSVSVPAGSHTVTASTGVSLSSHGAVVASGRASVLLESSGSAAGGIMCESDLDPLTGIPYSLLGFVPRGQRLGPTT